MRRLILATVIMTSLVLVMASCGKGIEKKLIGTWKISDVKTDFDETKVNPEMLRQVVDMQKQTYFRILNDSTLVVISNNNTHEASWTYDDEDQTITYFFKGRETRANVLGTYVDGDIVNKSKTAFGNMTVTYSKE